MLSKINTDSLKFNTAKFGCFKKKNSDKSKEIIPQKDQSTDIKKSELEPNIHTKKRNVVKSKEDRRVVLGVEVIFFPKKTIYRKDMPKHVKPLGIHKIIYHKKYSLRSGKKFVSIKKPHLFRPIGHFFLAIQVPYYCLGHENM